VPVKSSRRGVAWNGTWTGVGDRNVEPDGLGGGLQDGLDKLGGSVSAVKARPPLEVPVWAPLDDQASGFEVAGRREVQVAAMIQRCLEGW